MNTYLALKTLHIVSSVLLVGTGFGSAFHLFFGHRSGQLAVQARLARQVVWADAWFTTPAVLVQPMSGIGLAHLAGWPLSTSWIALALGLYLLAGACWLPVVWLQYRMACMAEQALATGQPLPAAHARLMQAWEWLGYPAFASMIVVFWLMVTKPVLW